MSSFAALVVPEHRRHALPALGDAVERMLRAAWPGRDVAGWEEHGHTASARFVRVLGDAFAPPRLPVVAGDVRAMQAGYFLSGALTPAAGVGGSRALASALAGGGPDALTSGDGVFAFAAWDAGRESFMAGVDKLGMRPLYWCEVAGGGVAVASEIKALLPLVGEPRVNWAAWEDQVRRGFQIGSHTLVHGISRFRRAECLTWRDGRLERRLVERFLEDIPVRRVDRDVFLQENHAVLLASVERLLEMLGKAPPLVTISGGLDSRRLLASLHCVGRMPELLTVVYPKPDGRDEETAIVERIARLAGEPVSVLRPSSPAAVAWAADARDAYADFETDEHGIYALIAAAGARPGVNFDGLAGDTLLNPGQFLFPQYLGDGGEERFLADMTAGGEWIRLPRDGEPFAERVRAEWEAIRRAPNPITIFALDTRGRRELSLGPMLIQARAFESVYPFLDRDFMRSAFSLPAEERLGGLLQRELTRRAWPALADIVSTRDPGFDRQPGVVRHVRGWRAPRPRAMLIDVLVGRSAGERLPGGERTKLLLAAVLGPAMGLERFDWQWGKANWVRRIRRQAAGVESPERYARDVAGAIEVPAGLATVERPS